jgi:nucleoside-diphosphate kinase
MEDKYSFTVDWYDQYAAMKRQYCVIYYPSDKSCEMIDLKNRRLFLKRSPCDNITIDDLFIGSIITILSRQLKIVDFGDEFTRSKFCSKNQSTLALIKPDCTDKLCDILDAISMEGFTICELRQVRLSLQEAREFYSEHRDDPTYENMVEFIREGPVIAMKLLRENAIECWKDLMGPSNPTKARQEHPNSLRARLGTNDIKNTCHGSDSIASAERELDFFFGSFRGTNTAKYSTDCTLCIIKPDAVKAGLMSQIIKDITLMDHLEISAVGLFNLEKANAEEFYEVYKGVVREYVDMVSLLSSGPCVAMEITGPEAHGIFRQMAGPSDPELARHLRPHTLRAKYGCTKVENAIHCTDLPDDGMLEVEYFFKILDNNNNN